MSTVNISKDCKILLDSDNATTKNTNSSCIFQIDPVKVRGFKINSFAMYNTLYNVNQSNNKFVLSISNTDYNVFLPIGFITSDSYNTAIQSAINAVTGQNVTVTYDDSLAKYTISGFTQPATFQPLLSTANKLLGFNLQQTGTVLVSDDVANTNPLDYVYITSSALSQLAQVTIPNAPFNNVIQKVVINNSTGYLIDFVNYSEFKFQSDSTVSLTNIDISIVDKNFKYISMQSSWSLEVQLEQVTNTVQKFDTSNQAAINSQNQYNQQNAYPNGNSIGGKNNYAYPPTNTGLINLSNR